MDPEEPNPATVDGAAFHSGHGKLTTPRAAAVAGIVFAVLMGTAYVLARLAIPSDATDREWLVDRAGLVQFALGLVPFAGIAFLWFIGVMRDRVGALEDRFFSTVLLGSGLLYLALTFVSVALAGGFLAAYKVAPTQALDSGLYDFNRFVIYRTSTVFALRMGAVFMISAGTIWKRTRLLPRWAVLVTYGLALIQLLGVGFSLWVTLILPAWVLMVSLVFMITGPRTVFLTAGRNGSRRAWVPASSRDRLAAEHRELLRAPHHSVVGL